MKDFINRRGPVLTVPVRRGRIAPEAACLAVVLTLAATPQTSVAQPAPAAAPRSPFVEAVPARSTSPAWFNLALPAPESDPTGGIVQIAGTDIPALPATFGPGPRDARLDGAAVKRDLRRIMAGARAAKKQDGFNHGRSMPLRQPRVISLICA